MQRCLGNSYCFLRAKKPEIQAISQKAMAEAQARAEAAAATKEEKAKLKAKAEARAEARAVLCNPYWLDHEDAVKYLIERGLLAEKEDKKDKKDKEGVKGLTKEIARMSMDSKDIIDTDDRQEVEILKTQAQELLESELQTRTDMTDMDGEKIKGMSCEPKSMTRVRNDLHQEGADTDGEAKLLVMMMSGLNTQQRRLAMKKKEDRHR